MAGQAGTRALVIVESPSKAKTIQGYLGKGFEVDSSVGHIRDIPGGRDIPDAYKGKDEYVDGINVEAGFEPIYVVSPNSKKTISQLKKKLKDADVLYLATDEDREGEAIAWHLEQVLRPKIPTHRMVFNEVTKDAILAAVENTREINQDLVDAQETRRILDRFYGFRISPILWRRVKERLSAGRVQSVALRIIVDRERERMAFVSANYWSLDAVCEPGNFPAHLVAIDGDRVATGADFDDTGALTRDGAVHLNQQSAEDLVAALQGADLTVSSVKEKPTSRKPRAPFITSTLQQEASRKLGWSASRTMSVAQSLYENGFITYMRTDSISLSQTAISAARKQATDLFGSDHVPSSPRVFKSKSKNAQEAHEAIRPAGNEFKTPDQLASTLRQDEFALYDLIWKRTIASQMADAKLATTTIRMEATATDGRHVEFSASGTVVTFPGHLAAYEEGRDPGDASKKSKNADDVRLPALAEGDSVSFSSLSPEGHDTKAPARFTEASLTKVLEEKSIGRPSTYADTMGKLLYRDYIFKRGTALVPTWLAFSVIKLLETHFPVLVDYDFTADLEDVLDTVAAGNTARNDVLSDFYFGTEGSDRTGGQAFRGVGNLDGVLDEIDTVENATFTLPGIDGVLRVGRSGSARILLDGREDPVWIPDELAPDELTPEKVQELKDAPSGDRILGVDPATGYEIMATTGRFGPYITEVFPEDNENDATVAASVEATDDADSAKKPAKKTAKKKAAAKKPRTASLFKDMSLDSVTLEDALELLTIPRTVGQHPEDGEDIVARGGPYGPFIKWGKETRSLDTERQILDITLDEAVAKLKEPKRRGRGASAGTEIGKDPNSGGTIMLKSGRFGPYVTDGEYNATVPRGEDPEKVDLARAADLLAERRAKGPAKKATKTATSKRAAKKTTKKAAKRPAKKAAAKKATKKAAPKK